MRQRGFTIIELIISMFIVVVLASMVTVAFNQNQQHKVLAAQGQLFLNVLRETQSKSLAGAQNVDKKVPAGGWGVRVDGIQYSIFGDANANGVFDAGEISTVGSLEKNLKFKNAPADIVFLPHKTVDSVCWNGVCGDAALKIITLENSQNGELFVIYIDSSVGKIFTE